MKRKKLMISLVIALIVITLSGCAVKKGKEEGRTAKSDLKIVTTFYPMYDFTRKIVGTDGNVELLIDGSIEPHDFEPSAKDIGKIQEADVFIYNSKEMETWVTAVLASIDTKKVKIIEASEGIELLEGGHDHGHDDKHTHDHEGLHLHGLADHYHKGDQVELEAHGFADEQFEKFQWFKQEAGSDQPFVAIENETTATLAFKIDQSVRIIVKLMDADNKVVAETKPVSLTIADHQAEEHENEAEDHHHEHDPHVWLDPLLAKQEVETITKGLIEADSQNQQRYEKGSQDFLAKLTTLDKSFADSFSKATNKIFVTQHTAFAYLAKRYGLEQVGISGLSPELEPTASELAEIETFVKKNQVKVLFTEDTASPKIAETIATATGAKLAVLSPIEGLSKEDSENGLDYLKVMERNLQALKEVIR